MTYKELQFKEVGIPSLWKNEKKTEWMIGKSLGLYVLYVYIQDKVRQKQEVIDGPSFERLTELLK